VRHRATKIEVPAIHRRGRKSVALAPETISALRAIQLEKRLSIPQLAAYMVTPFTWITLNAALKGSPVWEINAEFIAGWLRARELAK
jgi:hypothetical protein